MSLTLGTPAGPSPAASAAAGSDELDELHEKAESTLRRPRFVIRVLVITFLAIPAVAALAGPGLTGKTWFLVPATGVLILLMDRVAGARLPLSGWQRRWSPYLLGLAAVLGAALFAVGGMSWLTGLAVAAAALGRFSSSPRLAGAGVIACAAVGLGVSAARGLGYGNIFSATAVPALSGFLAHSAERRNSLIYRLRETRAELARMAVAEERLRIARDLHDLLGHSLSLIALKAELAGRLLEADPARAAGEIADLETVARRSLSEVRQAVTSYRQPGLAGELAAARRMLGSAGIDVRVDVPAAYSLPPAVDALLAWTVREGATNIARHAAARRACIKIKLSAAAACAELTNDGAGPRAGGAAADAAEPGYGGGAGIQAGNGELAAGSGLAGLAERAASLGGAMTAGQVGSGEFVLRVEVPLTAGPPGAALGGQEAEVNAAALTSGQRAG